MHERYQSERISQIFCDENKLKQWQNTELAVLKAMYRLGYIDKKIYDQIRKAWLKNPINIAWWKNRDQETGHDLNAFLDERYRFLPTKLHQYVHKNITSYDTEEAPFAIMLKQALEVVDEIFTELHDTLKALALKYRYVIMNARTHGQEAELQSFGSRILTWYKDLKIAKDALDNNRRVLQYSKLSGAIGKYGSSDPTIEEETLKVLGLNPYYGATQIMPRILYAPIGQSLSNLVAVIDKIATDLRLAARSGQVLMREPIKKGFKGSSAMPHKQNPINWEQEEGMAKMATGYMIMLTSLIKTWEERSIEQSSVERVAWPDLFHVVVRSLTLLNKTLKGLRVYPDNMLEEIHKSRGVYASSEVKEFLKEKLSDSGLSNENIYRIVQLACFNVFEPAPARLKIRETIPSSFGEALISLNRFYNLPIERYVSLADIIPLGELKFTEELNIAPSDIDKYNQILKKLFSKEEVANKWFKLFTPEFLLRNEATLYWEILRVK
jgi:adenylosuccinate lyase